jgi:hypothetical protein
MIKTHGALSHLCWYRQLSHSGGLNNQIHICLTHSIWTESRQEFTPSFEEHIGCIGKSTCNMRRDLLGGEKVTSVLILKCMPGLDFQPVESQ